MMNILEINVIYTKHASVFLRVDRRRNEEQFAPHCLEPFKQCFKITRWQNFSFIGMLFASLILPRQFPELYEITFLPIENFLTHNRL